MARKNSWQATVKLGGMAAFLGLTIAAWPVAGLLLGKFLADRWHWPLWVIGVTSVIGFIGGIRELMRMSRLLDTKEPCAGAGNGSVAPEEDPPPDRR